jgi:hypothetical protein
MKTTIELEPVIEGAEGDTWNDAILRYFLRSDFVNNSEGIGNWVGLFDTGEFSEDVLWQYIGESRFATVEEYAAKLGKTLEIKELAGTVETIRELAKRGNLSITRRDLNALRAVLAEYQVLFTQL